MCVEIHFFCPQTATTCSNCEVCLYKHGWNTLLDVCERKMRDAVGLLVAAAHCLVGFCFLD